MSNLFQELKRRNVVRVGIAYLVVGWLIIEVIDTIAPRLDMPEWVPTFFIILVLVGFPLALFFSWAYELTPQGVKKTHEVDADASITHSTGRKLDRVIIAALVVALGYFAWDKFGAEPDPGTTIASAGVPIIAVLPFVNMSSDAEQEYFSDGISEEILNVLARTEGLQVVSRTSSFAFKDSGKSITEIAASLKANIVLEGSVRKGGERVRITAQLIDARTGLHLWSEVYDREIEDIFAVQDEISQNIARALLGAVGIEALPENRFSGTRDTTAHNMYLQANAQLTQRSRESIAEAQRLSQLAVERDPEFADAWATIAKAALLTAVNFGQQSDYTVINNAIERALAADPDNGRALAVHALVKMNTGDIAGARSVAEAAIRNAPNDADAFFWAGLIHAMHGDLKTSLARLEKGHALNPANPNLLGTYLVNLIIAGDPRAEALMDQWEAGELQVPPNPDSTWRVFWHFAHGRLAEAEALFDKIYEGRPEEKARNGWFLYFAGLSGEESRIAEATEIIEARISDEGDEFGLHDRFNSWAALGRMDKAYEAFREIRARNIPYMDIVGNQLPFVEAYGGLAPIITFGYDPRPIFAAFPDIVAAMDAAFPAYFEGVEPYVPEGEGE